MSGDIQVGPDDGGPSSSGLAGLASLVRDRRRAAGLTQLQLAHAAGVSVGAVRDLEQGRTGQPRQRSVQRIAAALGVSLTPGARPAGPPGPVGRIPSDGDPRSARNGAPAPTGLRLQVLGSLTAWRDGHPVALGPARQRAVLALLAVQPNSLVRREAIFEALWEADPPATAVGMIQTYVSRLRRLLDPAPRTVMGNGLLIAAGTGYRLQVTGDELDLIAFSQLCSEARAAARSGQAEAACERYEQALDLWTGEPLADVDALRGHPAVSGLARQWAAAVEDFADAASGQGWHSRVLSPLRALTVREPLNERAHARLMIALAGSGQQATALEVFDAIRRRLDDQLGVRPGAELAAAHARVLHQHIPAAATDHGVPAAAPGPAAVTASPPDRPDFPERSATPGHAEPAGPAARRPTGFRTPGGEGEHLVSQVVPRQLPAATWHFVGRSGELEALSGLARRAQNGGAMAISIIGGTAGVGKTALAVQWARQVADQFPDGQLYVDLRGYGPASSPVSPAEALRGFLNAFAIPAAQLPAGQESLAGLYRSLLAGKRVLILLDNARDAAQVRPLLPGGGGCAVVITSRSQLTGLVASDGAQPLTLDVLTDDDARELLARRMGADRLAGEPAAAAELTGLCARLPLALAITATRAAAHPGVRLTELAAELDDVLARLDVLETGEAATSIRAVFSWSYESLDPAASRMFRLLALHPGPDIAAPAAGSLAGVDLQQAVSLLRTLTRAGLLAEPVPGRFAFHDLLRAYATELVRATETDSERWAAAHRVLDHYLHTAHTAAALAELHREPITLKPPRPGSAPEQLTGEGSALEWFRAENQILRAAIAQAVADGFDTHAWQLTCTLAPFAQRSGYWHQHEWSAVLATALAAAQRQGDITGQARVHWELGLIGTRLRRYDDSLSHLSRALDMYRQLGNAAGQAYCHLGLALMFDQETHQEEAIRHAERALDLYRSGQDRAGQAAALNAAGWYCAKLGHHQRALSYCQPALDLHRELGSRPGQAATLDSIGYVHHQLGRQPQAIDCYHGALGMLQGLADCDAEATVLTHLGDAQHANGDVPAARDAWQQALAILDEVHDPGADEVRAKLRELDP
jgi:DNA-binding SARP family transcriptional activator/tetratricopeptide (TPR) repeat protein/DNA-binding XRE family transcriptional regulator